MIETARSENLVREALDCFFGEDEIENFTELNKGMDIERKFKIICKNGISYFLKTSGNKEFTEQTVDCLRHISDCVISPLKLYQDKKEGIVILYPWSKGKSLIEVQNLNDNEYDYAKESAELLKKLHGNSTMYDDIAHWDLEEEFYDYKKMINQRNIKVPHFENWNNYFKKNISNMDCFGLREKCIVHSDFKADNLVFTDGGELRFVDVENIKYADPWSEFIKLTMLMSDSREDYSYRVIKHYFGMNIPEEFLLYMSCASILQLYKTALWNYNHNNKKNTIVQENYLFRYFELEKKQVKTWLHNRLELDENGINET